ncbi:uracil-DNA glycosylase [Sporolactobacillus shoreicorticis]|uniref:Uracil-DNA glycosylase n=1 Tax=Sporolactobacillus shoreicorticis TaxID=1923877 RepID=A0ABW5S8Q6_9BACL|nr:uracil-DNA glycosylase [Sporolactobacillus shoreicorticis]MCO7125510.1 uracil-DNA glycosylase [Sporolactobacillus shoreicorticis]
MKHILKNDWEPLLKSEFEKEYYQRLRQFLKKEYTTKTIYPDMYDLFNALNYTPYEKVKVVILGQDPYHEPGQAHGLSFSVMPGVQPPPSLQNIFKELKDDLGCEIPKHGCLIEWARQGVLLLNTVLSVRRGAANSHKGMGWEQFTDAVIRDLNEREQPIVFILWGRNAQAKEELITNKQHFIIKSPHPSPFSARYGFFGSRPFSRTNQFLQSVGEAPINWQISIEEPELDK